MRVRYNGPLEAVTVEAVKGSVVAKGETINVPAVVGRALVKQGWTKATKAPSKEGS